MKDGEHIEYFNSGEIFSKNSILCGKYNGESIDYYKSGEIKYKCFYIDGNLHGEYIRYYSNGEITYKYYYIYGDDVTELEWLCYNRNLKLELLGL